MYWKDENKEKKRPGMAHLKNLPIKMTIFDAVFLIGPLSFC